MSLRQAVLPFLMLSSLSHADCVSDCVNRRESRRNNTCMTEMCKRGCDIQAKHKSPEALTLSPDKRTLSLTGEIGVGFKAELDLMLETEDEGIPSALRAANQARSDSIQFLVLNSPGGDAKFAEQLQKWILKKGSRLKVIVPRNGICASACADLFRCAQDRVADESAILMYHPSFLAVESSDKVRSAERVRESNAKSEASVCATKAAESQGGKRIRDALLRGEETCYRASELGGSAAFLEVESSASIGRDDSAPSTK